MDVGGKCELCNWFSRRCVDIVYTNLIFLSHFCQCLYLCINHMCECFYLQGNCKLIRTIIIIGQLER